MKFAKYLLVLIAAFSLSTAALTAKKGSTGSKAATSAPKPPLRRCWISTAPANRNSDNSPASAMPIPQDRSRASVPPPRMSWYRRRSFPSNLRQNQRSDHRQAEHGQKSAGAAKK